MADKLTPYDTGERAEPKVWEIGDPEAEPGSVAWAMDQPRYGKVDFDDNESTTIATVWIERDERGRPTLNVIHYDDTLLIRVHA